MNAPDAIAGRIETVPIKRRDFLFVATGAVTLERMHGAP